MKQIRRVVGRFTHLLFACHAGRFTVRGWVWGRASRLAYREPTMEPQTAIRPESPRARLYLTTLTVSRRGISHDGYKEKWRV